MKTLPAPGIVGPLVTSYLSTNSDREFSKILKKFTPHIAAIAGTFPSDWRDDYIQEGSIGLFKALKGRPPGLPVSDFINYASRSIKAKMIDFYRSTVERFLIDTDIYLEDGSTISTKQPCLVRYPDFPYEDGDGFNHIENYTPLPEYASTLELGVDIRYMLADKQLLQLKLTDKEIRVVDLFYKQGHNTSTVSKFLHTSVSSASKLIGKANAKIKPYLVAYQSN